MGVGNLCSIIPVCLLFASAEQEIITADDGKNINLTCRAPNSNNSIIVVEWRKTDLRTEYVLLYRDEQSLPDEQHPSFKNRVDLQDRQMKDGDVSLFLKNVTINDTGTYECRIIQRQTSRRKRAVKDKPICIIYLRVAPPGPTGGLKEGGVSSGRPGLAAPGLLFLLLVAALLIAGNLP